ncbi:hypothetical protein [Pelosinus baikalensis]|uniref:Uncharacterized protein n=1 Tax=Pelosinus baikalensis TaxID=2892015 RepID=A0ABS8HXG7_9FIRM|nr:hypothetical protein [Pelosinus baikalensis]MCC5467854.1 hypothetical protein [Pelosinus baikalensis]
MIDLLSAQMKSIKAIIAYLKLLEPEQALESASKTGIIVAKELDANEREILGNAFIVIGSILTKLSCFPNEEKIKWQQIREVEIEMQEIEIELQKTRKYVDELSERLNLILAKKN